MTDTVTTPISAALKTAVLAAAQDHLSKASAEVESLKGALENDLTGIVTAGKTEFDILRDDVIGELTKLRAQAAGLPLKWWLLAVLVAAVDIGAVVLHFAHRL